MKYQCDTARDCGDSTCRHAKSHQECWRSRGPTKCSTADCLVRCNPTVRHEVEAPDDEWAYQFGQRDGGWQAPQTHTCYFCDREGTDVNRVHSAGNKRVLPVYCCDDGDACDARWQALETNKEAESLEAGGNMKTIKPPGENDRLGRGIRRAINGELFMHSLLAAQSRHKLSEVITARVMELVNESPS